MSFDDNFMDENILKKKKKLGFYVLAISLGPIRVHVHVHSHVSATSDGPSSIPINLKSVITLQRKKGIITLETTVWSSARDSG